MPYKNPAKKKAYDDAYREANRKELAAKQRERARAARIENPELEREKARERAIKRKERDPEDFRRKANEAAKRKYRRDAKCPEFRRKNVERVAEWVDNNRERSNAKHREIRKRRTREDVNYRLSIALRRRLYMAVRGQHRSGTAINELGCSVEQLKSHIESQFEEGMNWDNWSRDGWHIDHIRPLASFDLTDAAQVKMACHYTNLQPLWAKDNLKKHSHYEPEDEVRSA